MDRVKHFYGLFFEPAFCQAVTVYSVWARVQKLLRRMGGALQKYTDVDINISSAFRGQWGCVWVWDSNWMDVIIILISRNYDFYISKCFSISCIVPAEPTSGDLQNVCTLLTLMRKLSTFLLNATNQEASTSEKGQSHCDPVYSNGGPL